MHDDLMLFRVMSQLLQLFVLPDIQDRIRQGKLSKGDLPVDLKAVRIVQRRSPARTPVSVEINDEVRLLISAPATRPIAKGEAVTLTDLRPEECILEPPTYNGERAGFFLWLRLFLESLLIFDCSPNVPGIPDDQLGQVKNKFPISEIVQGWEFCEQVDPPLKLKMLIDNNWPPGPGCYPKILLRLHQLPDSIKDVGFVEEMAACHNREYWDKKLHLWREVNLFPGRLQYVESAVSRYLNHDFISPVYTIVPQIEGTVKAYLEQSGVKPESGFTQCVKDLKKVLLSRAVVMFPKPALEAVFSFLGDGDFWKYSQRVNDPSDRVNRHGIAHGTFTGFECKGIALKYLLLFDALALILLHDRMLAGTI